MNKLVSIIIVNYNGKHLLKECLTSVFSIDYPKDKYEVIVVDNDSQDDSVNYIKKNFPKVKIIESIKNLGFTGGNNLGIKRAKGEYYVFLNSDTRVDENWLKELVITAQDKNVGAVSSKLYYYTPFLKLEIKSETHLKANLYNDDDFSPLGLIVEKARRDKYPDFDGCWYQSGFYQAHGEDLKTRWTDGNGLILLPIDDDKEIFRIVIHGVPSDFESQSKYEIKLGGKVINSGTIRSNDIESIKIEINKSQFKKELIWLVQNAGNAIFKSGLGRDIGAVVKNTNMAVEEFYDFDTDYYQQSRKVVGLCGASFLIKKEIVDQIGLFNDNFFMYYEDVDLGLRLWKSGWDIVYQPKSIVYHKHRATTNKETTSFFIKLIKKNHLLFLLLHFPLKIFIIKFSFFYLKTITLLFILKLFESLKYYGGKYRSVYVQTKGRTESLEILKKAIIPTYQLRKKLEVIQKRDFNELVQHLY